MGQYADNDPATFEEMSKEEGFKFFLLEVQLYLSFMYCTLFLTVTLSCSDVYVLLMAEKVIEVAHAAANRWTDNIFTLKQWCCNNFPQAKEQLDHLYNEVGITDDFDYLEIPSAVPLTAGDTDT